MAKRKISIEEAFDTLREAGIQVEVKQTQPPELPTIQKEVKEPSSNHKVGNTAQKIFLHAQHMISNSGVAELKEGDEPPNTTIVYGPGWTIVPNYLASELLYRDQQARIVDAETRSSENKCYMVIQKRSVGAVAYSKVRVAEDMFMDLSRLGSGYMIDSRG